MRTMRAQAQILSQKQQGWGQVSDPPSAVRSRFTRSSGVLVSSSVPRSVTNHSRTSRGSNCIVAAAAASAAASGPDKSSGSDNQTLENQTWHRGFLTVFQDETCNKKLFAIAVGQVCSTRNSGDRILCADCIHTETNARICLNNLVRILRQTPCPVTDSKLSFRVHPVLILCLIV